jgi:hypothetical protein
MLLFQYIYIWKTEFMENDSFSLFAANRKPKPQTSVCLLQTENRNSKLPFVCCKQKTETANFRLFSANGKRKFGFLNRCMINGNQNCCFSKLAHPCQKHISYLYVKFAELGTWAFFALSRSRARS